MVSFWSTDPWAWILRNSQEPVTPSRYRSPRFVAGRTASSPTPLHFGGRCRAVIPFPALAAVDGECCSVSFPVSLHEAVASCRRRYRTLIAAAGEWAMARGVPLPADHVALWAAACDELGCAGDLDGMSGPWRASALPDFLASIADWCATAGCPLPPTSASRSGTSTASWRVQAAFTLPATHWQRSPPPWSSSALATVYASCRPPPLGRRRPRGVINSARAACIKDASKPVWFSRSAVTRSITDIQRVSSPSDSAGETGVGGAGRAVMAAADAAGAGFVGHGHESDQRGHRQHRQDFPAGDDRQRRRRPFRGTGSRPSGL